MALPSDQSTIDSNVVDYLSKLGSENPLGLRSVVFLFDDKPPLVFHKKAVEIADNGTTDLKIDDGVTARLKRCDYVQSIVYQLNPTCSWQIINGRHRTVCG